MGFFERFARLAAQWAGGTVINTGTTARRETKVGSDG